MRQRELPRPVLKWAGGKTQLLERILPLLPERIDTYFEPFVGGAAVFFALASRKRFRRAVLADRNAELVDVYRALQQDVDGVIRWLVKYGENHNEDAFYHVRANRPTRLVHRAARLIYLNKTGYNGLYRVNRAGEFNVPYGRYKRPRILDEPNLRAAAAALQGVELVVDDFSAVSRQARAGDAVYFDPPYLPLSRTSSFTAYDRHPFELEDHQRLAATFADLARRGVPTVLSNSATPATRALYAAWTLWEVQVGRSINSQTHLRGPVAELLVVNRPRIARPQGRQASPPR
ncbi:MAG: DNA adenine methylase [Polyangiaceae bacterium]|nr:DNA adenine methylase [Polyangiaceae bacterium]